MSTLEILNLQASVEGKPILKGVTLTLREGETHAIMGPNGSGKSTLSYVLMGHPKYKVDGGDIRLDGESLLPLSATERAKRGIFLAFQYPVEVSGVSFAGFLRNAAMAVHPETQKQSVRDFMGSVKAEMKELKMHDAFFERYLNEGFSGGEKKRSEILQMALLKPKFAILDETDSGLDIDALKIVSTAVQESAKKNKTGLLLITHYQRILKYVKPDFVHLLVNGKIAESGGHELAERLEEKGYEGLGD